MIKIRTFVKKIVPTKYHDRMRETYLWCRSLLFYGSKVICPVCNKSFRKFLTQKTRKLKARPNAVCPGCGVLERHRLLWLYLKTKTNFFIGTYKVLDVAPTYSLQKKFRRMKNLDYLSVDIESPLAMSKMDITNIDLPDNQFDCIICYHVLHHIPDDEKAMKELFRILKPGGYAILQHPVDLSNESEYILPREKMDGIFTRIYGQDYIEKLKRAGFNVKLDNYIYNLEDNVIKKYSLTKDEIIFLCTKGAELN